MKKILMLMMLMPLLVWADAETVGGITWTYTVSGEQASVGSGSSAAIAKSTTGSITIPSTLGGYMVKGVGDYAFYGCSGLTSVTIPEGVTSVGNSAFQGCAGLVSVAIPTSVTSIGSSAFRGCRGMADADGFVIIRDVLYDYYGNATSVRIPSNVTGIGYYAFGNCSGLISVTIPLSVTSIGAEAFSGTKLLAEHADGLVIVDNCLVASKGVCSEKVVVPYGVRIIGCSAKSGTGIAVCGMELLRETA